MRLAELNSFTNLALVAQLLDRARSGEKEARAVILKAARKLKKKKAKK